MTDFAQKVIIITGFINIFHGVIINIVINFKTTSTVILIGRYWHVATLTETMTLLYIMITFDGMMFTMYYVILCW